MERYLSRQLFYLTCVILAIFSCEDSTPVGSDLLGEEDISIRYTDTLDLDVLTVLSEKVITFTRLNFVNTTFLLGDLNDPIFGHSNASLYIEPRPIINNPPEYSGARFDSLVLMLEFAESGFYGDETLQHDITVYRVTERMDMLDTIFSDQEFSYDPNPIGSKFNYRNGRLDSVTAFNPSLNREEMIAGVMRIRMDDDFGKEIMRDTAASNTAESFLDLVNGLYIRSNVEGSSMMSFDFSVSAFNSQMLLYYRLGMDSSVVYQYPLNISRSTRASHFEHNIDETQIESLINVPVEGNDPLFMQGMNGVDIRVDISSIRNLDNILINHAQLEFVVAKELLGDTMIYRPVTRLGAMKQGENGLLVVTDDLFTGIVNNGLDRFFGGALEKDEQLSVEKYVMNITSHVKQIYKNRESPYIYITVFDKVQHPERIIVYGPEHSSFPAKLHLTYTNP